MPVRSELHIVVPGICGPLAEIQSLENNAELKRWTTVLSKSRAASSQSNVTGVVASIFNIKPGNDFPTAALTLLADEKYDAEKYYMHADPVHLRADMDHAVLTSSNDLNIKEEEAAMLCDLLNQHFKQDGVEFFLLNKNQWFVSTGDSLDIDTTPLVDATGRNVNFLLPEGRHSKRWKQVLTEAQMLMHSHEVNAARERTGQLSINSLWFHGSGPLPEGLPVKNSENNIINICSNDKMFKGLASHLNCGYSSVPASADNYAESLLANSDNSVNVLHLSALEHLVNYTDVNIWLEKQSLLLQNWIYPLIKAARNNNIKVTVYPCNRTQYQFSKYDSLRFWRSRGKLEKYVNSY